MSNISPDEQNIGVTISTSKVQTQLSMNDIKVLYFIEDIMSFAITGKIIFKDTIGLLEAGEFSGNEKLNITYGYNNSEQEFYLYKVIKTTPIPNETNPGTMKMVEALFVDEVYLNIISQKYSKSWKDTKYSDMVKDISENMLKVSEFEEWEDSKDGKYSYVMPYSYPNEAIKHLAKQSESGEGNFGYLWFENTQGYNYCTINKLLKKSLMTWGQDDGIYKFIDSNPFNPNKILSYETIGTDKNSLKYLQGGQLKGYNIKEKKLISLDMTFNTLVKSVFSLGKSALFPDVSNKQAQVFHFGDASESILKAKMKHDFSLRYNMQNGVAILVPGCDGRYAGGLIEIQWPSSNTSDVYNQNSSGKYLVKSITHYFDPNAKPKYKQKMVCVKNAMGSKDTGGLTI